MSNSQRLVVFKRNVKFKIRERKIVLHEKALYTKVGQFLMSIPRIMSCSTSNGNFVFHTTILVTLNALNQKAQRSSNLWWYDMHTTFYNICSVDFVCLNFMRGGHRGGDGHTNVLPCLTFLIK